MSVVGRFAPTPSGRMHLGNAFAYLLAWLSARSAGGEIVLRMEDLDTLRCTEAHAESIREDLRWLGLVWDRETPPSACARQPTRKPWSICGKRPTSSPAGAPGAA